MPQGKLCDSVVVNGEAGCVGQSAVTRARLPIPWKDETCRFTAFLVRLILAREIYIGKPFL